MPPRVALVSIGTRGDVEPLAHIAAALQGAGATVVLVTHASYRGLVELRGVPFASLGQGLLEARASRPEGQALRKATGTALLKASKDFMRAVGDDYFAACRQAFEAFKPEVAVLSTLSAYYHSSLCEALQIRTCVAHMCPLVPTGWISPPVGGIGTAPFAFINRWVWRFTTKLGWSLIYRDHVNELRASVGLAPMADPSGPFASLLRDVPTLLLHSPQLCPRFPDYPPSVHVLGAAAASDASDGSFEPPPALSTFLADAGAAPVVAVTLGSMAEVQDDGSAPRAGRSAAAVLRLAADAALAAGARALVLTAGAAGAEAALAGCGGGVLAVPGAVPHAWLLPKCAALVCHGGAGTVHAALRAGVPTVVLAVDEGASDQPFWGARLVASKLAPAAFTAAKVTLPKLATALRSCVGDAALRARVQAAAREVANENAVVDATRIILAA